MAVLFAVLYLTLAHPSSGQESSEAKALRKHYDWKNLG